ncbi:hypothetical protein FHG75_05010 [Xylella fastidiosa subsp. multiplex]|nr:hypothetical protein [Xylella fastidiosa subsp. multiplex]
MVAGCVMCSRVLAVTAWECVVVWAFRFHDVLQGCQEVLLNGLGPSHRPWHLVMEWVWKECWMCSQVLGCRCHLRRAAAHVQCIFVLECCGMGHRSM